MKRWKRGLIGFATLLLMSMGWAQSPLGRWITIDDKTGKKRVVVDISEAKGTLQGTIVSVFAQPCDTGVCQKCPGHFQGKPTKGLIFVWGLKAKGEGVWDDGHILDPKSGKIYRLKMTLQGDKLYVRGYIGLAALGRTQIWVRPSH